MSRRSRLRVAVFQPLVAAYRKPLFERLAALADIDLTVYAGQTLGSLKSIETTDSFRFATAPVRRGPLQLSVQLQQISALFRGFDLLIVPWDIHYLTLMICVPAARLLNIPLVLWGHGYARRPRAWADAIRNWYGRASFGVLLYNAEAAAQLVATQRFCPSRVFVANNALDQAPIAAACAYWEGRSQQLRAFQQKHSIKPAETLIFVSRLEPENDIQMLLYALPHVRKRIPDVKLVIIGDGSQRCELENLARQAALESAVIFPGAVYDELVLSQWMLSAAAFCYPTRIGLSILHAFGYGLPVITTDSRVGQNPERAALLAGHNGLTYRGGDIESLASTCCRILTDPMLRAELAAGAKATVAQAQSMDNMVAGFEALFEAIRGSRIEAESSGQRVP